MRQWLPIAACHVLMLCPRQVVADLAGEVKSLGLGSELDEAVNKVALAEFLVSSLAGLGVSSANINSVLVRPTDASSCTHLDTE